MPGIALFASGLVALLSAGAAPGDDARLTAKQLDACWASLLKHDDEGVRVAYKNMRAMMLSPESTVPFLKTRVNPVLAPEPKQVEAWFAALDSDKFETREEATAALEKAGPLIEGVLAERRKAGKLSLEADRRVAAVLAKVEARPLDPHELRARRAVEVLFGINTAEARQILRDLAKGAPQSPVTAQAKQSLRVLNGE